MAITVERKYGALRAIATIIKVLAVLFLVFTVIAALGMMGGSAKNAMAKGEGIQGVGMFTGAFAGFMMLIWGVLGTISLWAGAELICLLIDVEENTRKTHILLERGRD
jgi:hypothetical protein